MSSLLDAIRHFGAFIGGVYGEPEEVIKKWAPIQPVHIRKQAERLERLTDQMAEPDPVDLDLLCGRVLANYRGKKSELSRKEKRNIPFTLFKEKLPFPAFSWAVKNYVDLSRPSNVRRMLIAYFSDYATDTKKSEYIKQVIIQSIRTFPDIKDKIPLLRAYPNLLQEGTEGLGKRIVRKGGITESLKRMYFFQSCLGSDYVLNAIYHGFKAPQPLDVQMELLREVAEQYSVVYPYVVGYVILAVEQAGDADYKTELMNLTYKQMRDPRDGGVKWNYVEREAKDVYCHWLVKNDFSIFFSIIKQSADRTAAGERMWKYRQAFWSAYVDDVHWSKVILGPVGQRIAEQMVRQKKASLLNYDLLSSAGDKSNTSLLMMRLGKYTFIEVSYNGRLRIYENGKEPITFNNHTPRKEYDYSYDVVRSYAEAASFAHLGAESYSWQMKVSEWIRKYCGVSHGYKDWKLTDSDWS